MAEISKKWQDEFPTIKKNIEEACDFFSENYKKWNDYINFAFVSTMTDTDRQILAQQGKPAIEFNVVLPFIARLLGEFSKQEPSAKVSYFGESDQNPQVLDLIEGHIRHMEYECRRDGFATEIFKDQIAGGFGVAKVDMNYETPTSFAHKLYIERRNPTLCFFDPKAQKRTKSDADFCGEIFHYTKDEFKNEFPDIDISNINFQRNFSGGHNLSWAYKNQKTETLLVVDFYEKKKKKIKLLLMSDGHRIPSDALEIYMSQFMSQFNRSQIYMPKPFIVNERSTEFDQIHKYRLIQDQIISHEKTSYYSLPYIFFDGLSTTTKEQTTGAVKQNTRALIHDARDLQRLKNFAGQCLGAQLENMIMGKFKVPVQGIPEAYKDVYKDVQKASVYMYNQYMDNNPAMPLNPPEIIPPQPILPEVSNTFVSTDQMMQNVMGSYDAALGIGNSNVSGRAIALGAIQSNATFQPYVTGYLEGLTQAFNVVLQLLPFHYLERQSIPVLNRDGESSKELIFDNGRYLLEYNPFDFRVKVEAGVNFAIQKENSLRILIELLNGAANSEFAQFINSAGAEIILDNLDINRIDQIKDKFKQWKQQQLMASQQAAQQQQLAMQNDPANIAVQNDRARVQIEAQNSAAKRVIDSAKTEIDQEKVNLEKIKLLSEIQDKELKRELEEQDRANEDITKLLELVGRSSSQSDN